MAGNGYIKTGLVNLFINFLMLGPCAFALSGQPGPAALANDSVKRKLALSCTDSFELKNLSIWPDGKGKVLVLLGNGELVRIDRTGKVLDRSAQKQFSARIRVDASDPFKIWVFDPVTLDLWVLDQQLRPISSENASSWETGRPLFVVRAPGEQIWTWDGFSGYWTLLDKGRRQIGRTLDIRDVSTDPQVSWAGSQGKTWWVVTYSGDLIQLSQEGTMLQRYSVSQGVRITLEPGGLWLWGPDSLRALNGKNRGKSWDLPLKARDLVILDNEVWLASPDTLFLCRYVGEAGGP